MTQHDKRNTDSQQSTGKHDTSKEDRDVIAKALFSSQHSKRDPSGEASLRAEFLAGYKDAKDRGTIPQFQAEFVKKHGFELRFKIAENEANTARQPKNGQRGGADTVAAVKTKPQKDGKETTPSPALAAMKKAKETPTPWRGHKDERLAALHNQGEKNLPHPADKHQKSHNKSEEPKRGAEPSEKNGAKKPVEAKPVKEEHKSPEPAVAAPAPTKRAETTKPRDSKAGSWLEAKKLHLKEWWATVSTEKDAVEGSMTRSELMKIREHLEKANCAWPEEGKATVVAIRSIASETKGADAPKGADMLALIEHLPPDKGHKRSYYTVKTVACSTVPTVRDGSGIGGVPDVNGDRIPDVATVLPGQYPLKTRVNSEGVLVLEIPSPVYAYRDTNQNGQIDKAERKTVYKANNIQIHPMADSTIAGANPKLAETLKGTSVGCTVLPIDVATYNAEILPFIRKYGDSLSYTIIPESALAENAKREPASRAA